MAIDAGEIVATLRGDTKNFDQAMQKSNAEIVALGGASVAVGNIATQAFNFMAAGVVNLSSMVHRWAEEAAGAAERTQLLSMKLGIGERTLEGWGAALKRVGLDQDALAGGMKTLAKHIDGLGQGSEKSVELFGKLNTGMTATELQGVGTEKVIRLIADRFSNMSDGAEKARLAQELLGRAGLQLLPVLNQGAAGLDKAAKDAERFGLVLTDTQRGALLRYDDALDNLSLALEGFKKQVAAAFAPSLTKTIEMMTSAVSYAKSIFQAFSDAAEKLFIRFGALAASIEIIGKQLFSLSVLNKEAWEQTLNQVAAIDKWAAAEIKAVDAGKNTEVQMAATTQKAKEYTVSQQKLGEAIVAATQIQLKQNEAMGKVQERMGAGIVSNTQIALKQQADTNRAIFQQLFDEEDRRMKDTYAGSAVMIENVTAKQKALNAMQAENQVHVDAITEAYVEQGMAADAALVAETAALVEADKKNQEYQGKFIMQQTQMQQSMKFGWADVFGSMSQSAQFAFGTIRANFGQTVANLVNGTANWRQFWQTTQDSIINSTVQWGIDILGKYIAKNAMILATESATAAGVASIWTATSAAVMGAFGAMTGAIALFFTGTIIPMFAAVGTAVATFLSSIASALTLSIFGAPFSVPVWAAVGLVLAAVGVISAFAFGAFAEGGLVKGPMMGLVGEAGPELIVPLDKVGSLMGGGQQTVIVELDGRVLTKSVFDNMSSVMRIRGVRA